MKYEKPITTTQERPEEAWLQQNQGIFRILVGMAAIATLVTHFGANFQAPAISIMGIAVLLYVLLTHFAVRAINSDVRSRFAHLLSYLDAALIGAFVAYIGFSPLPSSLFLIMALYHAIVTGGSLRVLEHGLALAAGAIALSSSHPTEFKLEMELETGIASLLALTVYLCVYGSYTFYNGKSLHAKLKATEQQLLQLKLRAYKLSKYLSPALRKEILSGKEVRLETKRKKLTIFFSDIKGFSELAEEMETEALTALLNHYLTEMSSIALKFGATIDKFMGDGMMVFFGDPTSRGAKTDCVACVSMAIAMKKHMKELQLRWLNQGIQKPLEIRMGINTGYCAVGNFGTENRLDYTVLGTEINMASRLESAAEPGEILISHETYSLVKDVILCQDRGEMTFKGYQNPERVYSAIDMRKNLGKNLTYFEHAADGFSVYMDLDKINNYEKDRILQSLKSAAERLEKARII